jgi:hypothetical protein
VPVVHPRSQDEFLLPGRIARGEDASGYVIHFDPDCSNLIRAFRRFIFTGQASAVQEAA